MAEIECIAETADGSRHWIRKIAAPIRDLSGNIVGAVASVIDIDREKRAEEILERQVVARTEELENANRSLIAEMSSRQDAEQQVRQLQKMEAIGHLSGGIAHDFNNMLAVVMSALNMVERRLAKGEKDYDKYLAMARDGATRAANLTQRLLAFSRQQALAPTPVDANKLVAGMSDLLRRTLGATIKLETVLGGGLWLIHVDANQLESAILNLAVNARDAMREEGRLTIETANYLLDESYARQHDDVPPGQYVLIAVTDTGAGMAPEVIGARLRSLLHHQGGGQGHRPRPFHGLRLRQAVGRPREDLFRAGPGHLDQDLPAALLRRRGRAGRARRARACQARRPGRAGAAWWRTRRACAP